MWLWTCLDSKMCSQIGELSPWELKKWRKHNGPVEVFKSGFHASKNVINAMRNMSEVGFICSVEVQGERSYHDDIEAWSEMRILEAWKWTQKDNVALAVFAAELVIQIFERAFPGDDRPRRAIEAAKAWLSSSIEKNRQAAEKAAEAANKAAWMAASKDDKRFYGTFEAALAARDAARAAACEELAFKYAIDAEKAAEIAVATVVAAEETFENWKKIRRIIRGECHYFVLRKMREK